ncbi:MAG TPA: hypothetical protein VHV82_09060 [Sporichthyaceae bacterium]|nr:hypothetical protein [Sporichthyaceae bacterium]
MNWNAHLDRLQSACGTAEPEPAADAVAQVIDTVTDLVQLHLDLPRRAFLDPATRRALEIADLHLALAREHVAPLGPSAVPGDHSVHAVLRDSAALLDALLRTGAVAACDGSRDRYLHLRAAVRALRGQPLIPAQRRSGSAPA